MIKPQPKNKPVKIKYRSAAWKKLINSIDARDNLQCQLCNTGERLVVPNYHHVIFRSQGGGDTLDNMLTLCHEHHRIKIHGGGKDAQETRELAVKRMEEINGKEMCQL